jgi:hypothetical protein
MALAYLGLAPAMLGLHAGRMGPAILLIMSSAYGYGAAVATTAVIAGSFYNRDTSSMEAK